MTDETDESWQRTAELAGRAFHRVTAELEALTDRVKTVADESFGPFPVQTADEAMSCIEQGIFDHRREHERTRRELAEARVEVERLRERLGYPGRDTCGVCLHPVHAAATCGECKCEMGRPLGAADPGPAEFMCPACGPAVVDEDGCCVQCGRDAPMTSSAESAGIGSDCSSPSASTLDGEK